MVVQDVLMLANNAVDNLMVKQAYHKREAQLIVESRSLPTLPVEIIASIISFAYLNEDEQDSIIKGDDSNEIGTIQRIMESSTFPDTWKGLILPGIQAVLTDMPPAKMVERFPHARLRTLLPSISGNPWIVDMCNLPELLQKNNAVSDFTLLLYNTPSSPSQIDALDLPWRHLHIGWLFDRPAILAARDILDVVYRKIPSLVSLNVLRHIGISDSLESMKANFMLNEPWTPFVNDQTMPLRPRLRSARVPYSLLMGLLPVFSSLQHLILDVPPCLSIYADLVSALRSLPGSLVTLTLEDSRHFGAEVFPRGARFADSENPSNTQVDLARLKGLAFRGFSFEIASALMRDILCPSLEDFTISASVPRGNEALAQASTKLADSLSTRYANLKSLTLLTEFGEKVRQLFTSS